MTRRMLLPLLTALSLLTACAGDPSGETDAGTPGQDAGAADVGGHTDDASAPPDTDRPDLGDDSGGADDAGTDDGGTDTADAGEDAGVDAGGPDLSGDPIKDRPLRILFIGNSFTFGGPIPDLVRDLAAGSGWPEPIVQRATVGGYTLERHRERGETVAAVDAGNWDILVLQEFSTRPTDSGGNPAQFKTDATWFYDRARASSPDLDLVFYETWARHPDHEYYPGRYADADTMQAQLSFHYRDAVTYVPANATSAPPHDVTLAPAGTAWSLHMDRPDAERLHHPDDWHAGTNGQYLNALVIYSTIFNRSATGLPSLGRAAGAVAKLQADADSATGKVIPGGPDGVPPPAAEPLAPGRRVLVDFGADGDTTSSPWNNIASSALSLLDARDDQGRETSVDVSITRRLASVNEVGLDNNTLGWPSSVSRDRLWTGSFDGHQAARGVPGEFAISGLEPGAPYALAIYAARSGDDSGNGRLTRYSVAGDWRDLEVASNQGDLARFERLVADADGAITVEVAVSPDGGSRFAYVGALELERLAN